ncbi:MAG: tryptophan 7-halogenase [Myxococcales bacterium]|nr:tryptophan 7-halogenase [Myxococcales bacterium]
MDVVVVGNGIVGNLAALYLRRRLPDSHITIIGPASRGGAPVVGESTIEITAQFLENELGLGEYLREHHYPKYSLTYYFKLHPDDPADRTYSVQCNERDCDNFSPLPSWQGPMARPPAWQLNREVFDRDMRARVDALPGVTRIHGMVSDVALDGERGHTLTVRTEAGAETTVKARWLVDVSGRRRLLARKLGLTVKVTPQRHAFWFRLAGFRRELLANLDALGPHPSEPGGPYHYERFYSTHHFMGRGNWIWLIPMRGHDAERGEDMISIGLTQRPDIYRHDVRDMQSFMAAVSQEHPVITDLVASGRVLDTNLYRNYRYETKQVYSADRWCLVGDAAVAVDPLFSNGLAFSMMQLQQVGEMIASDLAGDHDPAYIERLDRAFWAPVRSSQQTIGNWYSEMHDPVLSAVRLNMIETTYFYFLLPMVTNRCHFDRKRLGLWKLLELNSKPIEVPQRLVDLRRQVIHTTPDHFAYYGKAKVNPDALRRYASTGPVRQQMARGAALLDRYFAEVSDRLAPVDLQSRVDALAAGG